ncbi:uncharacterized protein LOC114309267 [Camellia sinensis]|uniref:uncharacterized protein LOC114309267 n=1 Tax=Camellia sinensis TaxID=4442 RepID=UPI0010366179|nr:uncharacterized protein LOC114309267 [Camellia sinensis]
MIGPPDTRRRGRRCEYQKDRGHDTDSCYALKDHLEEFVQDGRLAQHIRKNNPPNTITLRLDSPPLGVIHIIYNLLSPTQVVPISYNQLPHFLTKYGIEQIRGPQKSTQACYLITAVKKPKELEVNSIEVPDRESLEDIGKTPSEKATEDLDWVEINGDLDEFFMIGTSLNKVERHDLRASAVIDEIDRLLDVRAIREVTYPTWLSNIVVVKKKNGSWHVCVDFTDLNRACPKECFPHPKIDQLVDAMAHHQCISLLDAYKGYHQIAMHPEDQEKTAFLTPRETYCYKVMPFGLKNARATYQRLVTTMFKEQLSRTMEVYIDDMVVKSKEKHAHLANLSETFGIL